jgi:hypothetical protein
MKHNHNGFAAVLALVVIVVIGIFSLGVWRYLDTKKEPTSGQQSGLTPTPQQEVPSNIPDYTINIKELGLKILLENPPYDDITYEMTSINLDGPKYVAAVYSKDLLERNLENCGERCKSLDEWEKLSCNKTISVYYYDPSEPVADSPSPINPKNANNDSRTHSGAVGPCEPSSDPELYEEYKKFFEYIDPKVQKEAESN